jgi:hypothetical protein
MEDFHDRWSRVRDRDSLRRRRSIWCIRFLAHNLGVPPERADRLTVLDLEFKDAELGASAARFSPRTGEAPQSAPLEIYWHAKPKADATHDFWVVGDGAAFVRKNPDYREPEVMDGIPESSGSLEYSWTDYSDVIIALLPRAHGVAAVGPPAQAKVFGDRLALLWHPPRDRDGRVRVEWTLRPVAPSLKDEERGVNRKYRAAYPKAPAAALALGGERAFLETQTTDGSKMMVVFNGPAHIGALGMTAQAHDVVNQTLPGIETEEDWARLVQELSQLRGALRHSSATADQDLIVGVIAGAEHAAQERNASAVADYLSRAGKWAFDTASGIGISLATDVMKAVLRAHGVAI